MTAWRTAPGADPGEVPTEHNPTRSVVRQAWGILGIGDRAGVLQWLSPSVEQVLGYRPDELVGSCGLDLLHPDDRERVEAAHQSLGPGGGPSAPVTARA